MEFTSAATLLGTSDRAVADLAGQLEAAMDPASFDLALLFCTPHFEDELESILADLSSRLPGATLLGCTAEGTIGVDREMQRGCSMAVLAGSMPGVEIRPFDVDQSRLADGGGAEPWAEVLGVQNGRRSLILALGDPFSFDIQRFLERINDELPGVPIVGGMASGAEGPGQNRLFVDGRTHREGLVGVTLSGGLSVRTVVSQGCRPIGEPLLVTRGDGNVIRELGGRPALQQLSRVIQGLPEQDIKLARHALFVGRVINEYQEAFARGDFLIHNIISFDPDSGALAIAAPVKVGSTVQFHVRDADCADEDLRSLLGAVSPSCAESPPAAAILFSCNGRGMRMWPQEGHDVSVLRELCGPVPVAGFFAGGEIGPVGGRNFIHGFTASIALLSAAE